MLIRLMSSDTETFLVQVAAVVAVAAVAVAVVVVEVSDREEIAGHCSGRQTM